MTIQLLDSSDSLMDEEEVHSVETKWTKYVHRFVESKSRSRLSRKVDKTARFYLKRFVQTRTRACTILFHFIHQP